MTTDPKTPISPTVTDYAALLSEGTLAAIEAVPVLGSVVNVVRKAEAASRERRLRAWESFIAAGSASATEDEIAAFRDALEDALSGPEANIVRSSVLESARVAVDAVDEFVIPSIALLARRRLDRRTPSRRIYRDLLEMLRVLDVDEFIAVRRLAHQLQVVGGGDPILVRTGLEPGGIGQWYVEACGEGGALSARREVLRGEETPRVISALTPLALPSGLLDDAPRPKGQLRITRELVEILVGIMPLPTE